MNMKNITKIAFLMLLLTFGPKATQISSMPTGNLFKEQLNHVEKRVLSPLFLWCLPCNSPDIVIHLSIETI